MDLQEFLFLVLAIIIYYILIEKIEGINPTLDIILNSEFGVAAGALLIMLIIALIWRLFYEIKKRLKK